MCGMPHFMVHSSGPHLSAPGPFSHSKVPSTPSLSLHSSYAGDLTLRNGCRDCYRAIWLPFLEKKNVGLKYKQCTLMIRLHLHVVYIVRVWFQI